MKVETFFEKFDQFAEAPNAVRKFRDLVLNLAVQGKLVPQDPADESVQVLLERVRAARDTLILDRRIKQSDEVEYSVGDAVEAPPGWVGVHVNDVAIVQGGKRLPNGAIFSECPTPHVYIRVTDMKNGTISETGLRFISPIVQREIARYTINKEDLYITIAGTIGDVGSVPESLDGQNLTENAAKIVFRGFERRFLQIALASNFVQAQFLEKTKQMAQPKLALKRIAGAKFFLPPLAEQKRIITKVDELMALSDRLEAQHQERETRQTALVRASLAQFADAPTPANLNLLFHPAYTIPPVELRKSILTLAVQGKLVRQDPNDEPAEDCLLRLGLKSTVTFQNGSDTGDGALPPSWARVRFEDIALVAGGVTLGRKLGQQKTVTLPYLRVANVKRGEIDLRVIKEVSIAEDEIERYALRENDLLMTEGGDWDKVGRAAIWKAQIAICLHQNHVFRARMRSTEITSVWFERYFNSPDGRSYFESASKQTTNLASINMRQVRGCPVPFPPLAEQYRIVAKVDQLLALVTQLESQLTTSRTTAGKLMEAIVAELTATE